MQGGIGINMESEAIPFVRKIWGALSAIASSILTAIICDEFSSVSYEVVDSDSGLLLVPASEYHFLFKCLLIGAVFFFLWAIISGVIPFFYRILKRLKYRNKKKIKRSDILTVYQISKEKTLRLNEKISAIQSNDFESVKILYSEEISLIIIQLYKTFCPGKKSLNHIVKSTFRSGDTIYEVGRYISPYEFDELICVIENLLSIFSNARDEMLLSDYSKLCEQISDLKQVNKFLPNAEL